MTKFQLVCKDMYLRNNNKWWGDSRSIDTIIKQSTIICNKLTHYGYVRYYICNNVISAMRFNKSQNRLWCTEYDV